MSYFESLKKLKHKIFEKNIISITGNVDENYIPSLDTVNKVISKYNEFQIFNLIDYLKHLFKEMGFKKIYHFNPSEGCKLYDNNLNEKEVYDNKESNDEFENDSNASLIPLSQFILTINDNMKIYKDNINSIEIKDAYIIDLSDFLLTNNSQEILYSQLSILINSFVSNLYNNTLDFLKNDFKLILINRNKSLFNHIAFNNIEFVEHNLLNPSNEERTILLEYIWPIFNYENDNKSEIIKQSSNLLDGKNFKQIFQMLKVSHNVKTDNFKSLYRLVSFDKYESEWEKLDLSRINEIDKFLSSTVKGQNEAIDSIKKSIIRSRVGLQGIMQTSDHSSKPKGILFFAGPTGVGKTELAKQLTEFVFGDQSKFIRFDMSEYNHEHSDQKLIGAPPGYVGYENGGQLTNAVKEKPFSIILFDEIEKAHGKIFDKFLQILEDGRLTSSKGEIVDFSETFIIFTSNIGSSLVSPNESNEMIRQKYINAISSYFKDELGRPEILNRIGIKNVVPFNFIKDYEIISEIISSKMKKINKKLNKDKKINLIFNEDNMNALIKLINDNYDKSMGGRGLITTLEKYFIDELSNFIFTNSLTNNDKLVNLEIYIVNNKINFKNV